MFISFLITEWRLLEFLQLFRYFGALMLVWIDLWWWKNRFWRGLRKTFLVLVYWLDKKVIKGCFRLANSIFNVIIIIIIVYIIIIIVYIIIITIITIIIITIITIIIITIITIIIITIITIITIIIVIAYIMICM